MTTESGRDIPHISEKNYSPNGRLRLKLLQLGMIFLFVVIILKLVQIQIIDFQRYKDIVSKRTKWNEIPAPRGMIIDRNGGIMVSNSTSHSFVADPTIVDSAKKVAAVFSKVFGKPATHYHAKLNKKTRFVLMEKDVEPDKSKAIEQEDFKGIRLSKETKRLYYNAHLAGQVAGAMNRKLNGVAGIEAIYDSLLKGIPGRIFVQRTGLGNLWPRADYPRIEPVSGHNIYLSLDMNMQAIAESELESGVILNKADRGLAIIVNPTTGEILAMAQYPSMDPNNFGEYSPEDRYTRAVMDVYEPGSVFKIVTASVALEGKLVPPEKMFFAENGKYLVPVPKGKPRMITDTHREGWITFQRALEVSSNIVMAKVGTLVGPENFFRMARHFGFGTYTDVDIPSEAKGVLPKPAEWSGISLKWMSFGYGVGVTPIQIAMAYAAIANDGILMKPYLLLKETDADGRVIHESQPQEIRRVISQETARTLKTMLRGVVENGTGTDARVKGTTIAGKTGTSRRYGHTGYEAGSYVSSFVGFFPAESPKILCLVMLDNPKGKEYYGGRTSGPIFKAIAEKILNTSEFFYSHNGDTGRANPGMSAEPKQKAPGQNASVKVQAKNYGPGVIPDFKGCSMKQAVSILNERKLRADLQGHGMVVSQVPEAGQPARSGMKVTLQFGRNDE